MNSRKLTLNTQVIINKTPDINSGLTSKDLYDSKYMNNGQINAPEDDDKPEVNGVSPEVKDKPEINEPSKLNPSTKIVSILHSSLAPCYHDKRLFSLFEYLVLSTIGALIISPKLT